ncbi:hypothetical protein M1523_04415 [Patescibacteria group bacterium]|nr:hypothetical protein [Patescibacteria group bacterium]MCL5091534.1 hypothetical protein [Patescibacteria group bacterium]
MDVQILFGVDEIKKVYEKSLEAKALNVICLAQQYGRIIGDYFDKSYAPRLFGSQTITREILTNSQANRDDAGQKDGKKNQVRFIRTAKKSESDLMIFDHQAIMVSYNQKAPFALIISDQELVTNLENQFEALWGSLQ